MSFDGPPRPPARPPSPPRAIEVTSEVPTSPFGLPAPQVRGTSPVAESEASNPFLVDFESAPVAAPTALRGAPPRAAAVAAPVAPAAPRVIPPPSGAPLRVHAGVEAPTVRDPHAEFRRGTTKRPLIFGALGALTITGLFLGLPGGDKKEGQLPGTTPKVSRENAVIGSSLSPERTPSEAPIAAEASRAAPPASVETAQVERPSGIAHERDFARAFKEKAQK